MSSVLPVIVGILVIVVGIAVSIALHEVGHMVPAKAFGVRVSQYMIGFGPTLWSKVKGETEYGVKAFPLGGYVRMVGMMPGAPEGTKPPTTFLGRIVADARDASTEEILPGEEHRAFYNLSTPKKLVIMLGGPVMNLVLAAVFLSIALLGIGVATPTTTVASVTACVPTATTTACAPDAAPAPAKAAGLEAGDTVTSFAGTPVSTWDELTAAIDAAPPGAPAAVVVDRAGAPVTLSVTPTEVSRVVDDAGTVKAGPFVGIAPAFARQPASVGAVLSGTGELVKGTASMITTLPVRVAQTIGEAFGDGERSPDSVMSVVGVGQAAVQVASLDTGVLDRVAVMLTLLASLNVALFVFNLIPLLPLDGGHVVNALYEGGKRQVARLRGVTPLPGPADVARMMPVAYVMFIVLLGAGVLLMLADVVDPVRLA